MRFRHFLQALFILAILQGCVTTKIIAPEEANICNDLKTEKKNFLILYNQNNQYDLRNYEFRRDTLEGELFVPRFRRSNGLMVFTASDFRVDNISSPVIRIPGDKIYKIQLVKPDIWRTVGFIAGITAFTLSLWWAGNLIFSGLYL